MLRLPIAPKTVRTLTALSALLLVALYAVVLVTTQRFADGDEAVIGIMARHILTQDARPLFFYGQEYNAGAGLEAYLAAAAFALFGTSGLVLRAVALGLFVAGLAVTWWLCRRHFSAEVAFIALLVMGVATPLIELRSKMRGGYAALPLLTALALLCYFELLDQHKPTRYMALGTVLGVSFLNSALSVSLMLAIGVVTLLAARRLFRPSLGLAFVGFAIGLAPLIRYDLRNEFAHINYLLDLRGGEPVTLDVLQTVLTDYLPRFFVANNVDGYVPTVPLDGWIELALVTLGVLVGAVVWWRDEGEFRPKILLLLVSVPIHLLFFAFSRERVLSARYFLSLYPSLAILFALAVVALAQRHALARTLAATALGSLLLIGLVNNLRHIGPPVVNDDILDTNWQIANVPTSGDLTTRLITLLQAHDVTHVRSGYFIQWRLLFESKESVIASSERQFPTIRRYVDYDNAVNTSDRVAEIFHIDSQHLLEFLNGDRAAQMQRVDVDAYAVFLPK